MYSKSVVPCTKYTKCSNNFLECVFSADLRYVSDTGKEWVCKTCDRTLKRGVMPLQAIANGLQLSQIPPELSALELRLICLRVPFMKMVALPSGAEGLHFSAFHWVCVCLSVCLSVTLHLTSRMFVRLTNDTTYLTGNEGQKFRTVFSENAPLQSCLPFYG